MLSRGAVSNTPRGLEQTDVSSCDTKYLRNGGNSGAALSGALSAKTTSDDPDLALVVKAWPDLPETVKADIMATVKANAGEDKQ